MARLEDMLGRRPIQFGDPVPDDPSITPGAWEAEVLSVDGDSVVVRVSGYSSRHDFGPCPYIAPAGAPAPGERALAVFSNERGPWVIVPGVPPLPVPEPPSITGSRAGNAALASLLAAGDALGLWIDDTTA